MKLYHIQCISSRIRAATKFVPWINIALYKKNYHSEKEKAQNKFISRSSWISRLIKSPVYEILLLTQITEIITYSCFSCYISKRNKQKFVKIQLSIKLDYILCINSRVRAATKFVPWTDIALYNRNYDSKKIPLIIVYFHNHIRKENSVYFKT